MNKLLKFINSLSSDERICFSECVKTSIGYMRKACSKKQILNAITCLAIERATNGAVTRADLRPNDYWKIWPDLPAPALEEQEGAE